MWELEFANGRMNSWKEYWQASKRQEEEEWIKETKSKKNHNSTDNQIIDKRWRINHKWMDKKQYFELQKRTSNESKIIREWQVKVRKFNQSQNKVDREERVGQHKIDESHCKSRSTNST